MSGCGVHYTYLIRGKAGFSPILVNFYIMLKLSTGKPGHWIKAKNDSVDH